MEELKEVLLVDQIYILLALVLALQDRDNYLLRLRACFYLKEELQTSLKWGKVEVRHKDFIQILVLEINKEKEIKASILNLAIKEYLLYQDIQTKGHKGQSLVLQD